MRSAFPEPDHVVCIRIVVSKRLCAVLFRHAEKYRLEKPIGQQEGQPLIFLGRRFTGKWRNRIACEKKSFVIVLLSDRINYMLTVVKQTLVMADHWNPLYIFASLALISSLPRQVLSEAKRLAIHFLRFELYITHIVDENNAFADILTRRSKQYKLTRAQSSQSQNHFNGSTVQRHYTQLDSYSCSLIDGSLTRTGKRFRSPLRSKRWGRSIRKWREDSGPKWGDSTDDEKSWWSTLRWRRTYSR